MSSRRVVRTCIAAAGLLCSAVAPLSGQEQETTGAQIVERYHAAVGGIEAFRAVRSLHSIGELFIPAAAITGSVEVWQARPDLSLMYVNVPGFGEVRSGYTGATGWSLSSTEGARLMTGDEALQAADDAHFESHLRTAELVDSLVYMERATMGGQPCDKVRVVWRSGRVTQDCFASDTGLLIASIRRQYNPAGGTEAVILYQDYIDVEDIRLPSRISTRISGIEQVITLREVQVNVVDDAAFEPPPGIRELIRR